MVMLPKTIFGIGMQNLIDFIKEVVLFLPC